MASRQLVAILSFSCYFIAFFIAGIWHGSTWNFAVFGLLQGLGVSVAKLWEMLLVKRFGRQWLKSYLQSSRIRAVAIFANFHYFCLTVLFFPPDLKRSLSILNHVAASLLVLIRTALSPMNSTDSGLQRHHVGCLVTSIAGALQTSLGRLACGPITEQVRISSQKVSVCFIPIASGTFIELVEPDIDNKPLRRLLDRGTSFYHLGFFCKDIASMEETLTSKGARAFVRFSSEAFGTRKCVFMLSEVGQMIELIEAPPRPDIQDEARGASPAAR